jgi:hypothetical protein
MAIIGSAGPHLEPSSALLGVARSASQLLVEIHGGPAGAPHLNGRFGAQVAFSEFEKLAEVSIIVRLRSPHGRPIARRARDSAIEIGTRSHGEEFAGIAQHVGSCRIGTYCFSASVIQQDVWIGAATWELLVMERVKIFVQEHRGCY